MTTTTIQLPLAFVAGSDTFKIEDDGVETWMAEASYDLTTWNSARFALAYATRTAGVAGTVRLRMGGTSGQCDGPVILTMAALEHQSLTALTATAARVVGHGSTLFKMSLQSGSPPSFIEAEAGTATLTFGAVDSPATKAISAPTGQDGGDDVWLDQTTETGAADTAVTTAGDWASVSDSAAVEQSLIRDFLSDPNSYPTNPNDYGGGLTSAVKKRMRQTDIDELSRRLRARALADRRVAAVQVAIARLPDNDNGIQYTVTGSLVAGGKPFSISGKVS